MNTQTAHKIEHLKSESSEVIKITKPSNKMNTKKDHTVTCVGCDIHFDLNVYGFQEYQCEENWMKVYYRCMPCVEQFESDSISSCYGCSSEQPESKMSIDEYGYIYCNVCVIDGEGKFREEKRREKETQKIDLFSASLSEGIKITKPTNEMNCSKCDCVLSEEKMSFEVEWNDGGILKMLCADCFESKDEDDVLVAVWKFGTSVEVDDADEFDADDYKDYMFANDDDEGSDCESECDQKQCCACRYDFAIADICMISKSPELWRCSECSADEDRRANEVDSDDEEIDEEERRFIDACLNDDFETQKAMMLKKIEDGRLRREKEETLKIDLFPPSLSEGIKTQNINNKMNTEQKKRYTCSTCGLVGHNKSNQKFHPVQQETLKIDLFPPSLSEDIKSKETIKEMNTEQGNCVYCKNHDMLKNQACRDCDRKYSEEGVQERVDEKVKSCFPISAFKDAPPFTRPTCATQCVTRPMMGRSWWKAMGYESSCGCAWNCLEARFKLQILQGDSKERFMKRNNFNEQDLVACYNGLRKMDEDFDNESDEDEIIVSCISCKTCGFELPPMTMTEHLDPLNHKNKCKCP